jgi:hypothetical protein
MFVAVACFYLRGELSCLSFSVDLILSRKSIFIWYQGNIANKSLGEDIICDAFFKRAGFYRVQTTQTSFY